MIRPSATAGGARVRMRRHGLTLIRPAQEDAAATAPPVTRSEGPLIVARGGRLVRRSPQLDSVAVSAEVPDGDPLPSAISGRGARFAIAMFIISVILPLSWAAGPVRLTPYLLVLVVATIPCTVMWLGRKRTPIIVSDILVLLFCVWASAALLLAATPMASPIEGLGVLFLQTFGPYLLARMTIRDAASMRFMVRCAVLALAVILPWMVLESLTGRNLILQVAHLFGNAPNPVGAGKRMGLTRAQGPFEHPILMGVFCASILSMAFYALRDRRYAILRSAAAPISFLCAMLSLSTGALLTINVQLGFMLWVRLLRTVRQRWRILSIIFVVLYVLLDAVTTRSPFHTFVRYMTFSAQSSYNRILIWQFGSAEALRHPLFGIGAGDWQRPSYMSDSMDNFWLVQAVRYGLPALALLFGAIWVILRRMARVELRSTELILLRRGAMFSIVATMISVISVHLWNATYVWFMFLIGSSAWMSIPRGGPGTTAVPAR